MMQPMQKDERRNAHVRGAMHEHALTCAGIHHARESLEVRRLRRVELHRDVELGHALRGNQLAFVREGVVGRGQREVDDDVEARLSQRGEIVRLRHAARGQPVINAQKIADVGQSVNGVNVTAFTRWGEATDEPSVPKNFSVTFAHAE
jgi:hypothetical protein